MTEGAPEALHALAERAGILASYVDNDGVERHTSDDVRVEVLAAMGIEARGGAAAQRSLRQIEEMERARPFAPVRVLKAGAPERLRWCGTVGAKVEIRCEDGTCEQLPVRRGARGVRLPRLAPGVHEARLSLPGAETAVQHLVVVPAKCLTPAEVLGDRRVFGLWANLYSLRTERGAGFGDLTALRDLVHVAGAQGAAFVGISPLHAHRNQPPDISPYCGLSRIFRNPIYLDVEAVPELRQCERARELLAAQPEHLARLRAAERVDYAAIAAWQGPLFEALYETFERQTLPAAGARAAAYLAMRERDGGLVVDWGVYSALAEVHGPDWRAWPATLHDARSAEVRAFAEEHRGKVDRHVFLQFELERQLAAVAGEARDAGLSLGLYQDLALGSSPAGFDAWALPGLFVPGVSLGAPPDAYASEGQDWAIPPIDPRRIGDGGYLAWRLVLGAGMQHSGVLRIDHAMGMARQFWVPHGRPAAEGCYVLSPQRDLLGVVALMSRRHQCLVVGEDLGTLPPGFGSTLARAGVLSSRVLLFERDHDGVFYPAARYGKRALVTANTHDHATLASYALGRDLDLRRELGLLDGEEYERAVAERKRELAQLRRRLCVDDDVTGAELVAAVYAFLGRTPAPLVGVSLDDLAGEIEPVNIPGVRPERYRSWTRRMTKSVDELARDAEAWGLLRLRSRRGQEAGD